MAGLSTEKVTLDVADGTSMDAYLARPDDGLQHPGMIVFQEAFGINGYMRDVTERFARLGFMAIAPELFHRTGAGFEGDYADMTSAKPHLAALTDEGLLADAAAAYDFLADDERVERGKIASVGFCLGGRVSFLANSALTLATSISFYGGGIAPALAKDLHGPMLFFWGGQDTHIPPETRRATLDAMLAADKAFVNIEYSNAGHGFFCDQRASYHAEASEQAWVALKAFLRLHIRIPQHID